MRVDFYVLGGSKSAELVICSLVHKAYRQAWRIGIHAHDALIQRIDNILWSEPANSFLPHQIITSSRCQSSQAPIMLFNRPPDDIHTLDYYINLSDETVHYTNTEGRLAEIIQATESSKSAGRTRYSNFKKQAYTLYYHELS